VTTTDAQGGGTTQTKLGTSDGINAFGVIIRYQSSDFTTTSLSATPSSSSDQQLPITSSSATTSATVAKGTTRASSGLSTGAKAGISVAVVVGALLVLVAGVSLLKKSQRHTSNNDTGYLGPSQLEMEAGSVVGPSLQQNALFQAHELPGDSSGRAELAGDRG
jgi:hypothetical protein